jgi:hypothetical protein
MKPGETEFWRVANASADTIIDLQLQYDGVAQSLQVVALDGVPTGSQDGTMQGQLITQTDILLAPCGAGGVHRDRAIDQGQKRDV